MPRCCITAAAGALQVTVLFLAVWWSGPTPPATNWLDPDQAPVRPALPPDARRPYSYPRPFPKVTECRGSVCDHGASMQVGCTVFWLLATLTHRTAVRVTTRSASWPGSVCPRCLDSSVPRREVENRLYFWIAALPSRLPAAARFWTPGPRFLPPRSLGCRGRAFMAAALRALHHHRISARPWRIQATFCRADMDGRETSPPSLTVLQALRSGGSTHWHGVQAPRRFRTAESGRLECASSPPICTCRSRRHYPAAVADESGSSTPAAI